MANINVNRTPVYTLPQEEVYRGAGQAVGGVLSGILSARAKNEVREAERAKLEEQMRHNRKAEALSAAGLIAQKEIANIRQKGENERAAGRRVQSILDRDLKRTQHADELQNRIDLLDKELKAKAALQKQKDIAKAKVDALKDYPELMESMSDLDMEAQEFLTNAIEVGMMLPKVDKNGNIIPGKFTKATRKYPLHAILKTQPGFSSRYQMLQLAVEEAYNQNPTIMRMEMEDMANILYATDEQGRPDELTKRQFDQVYNKYMRSRGRWATHSQMTDVLAQIDTAIQNNKGTYASLEEGYGGSIPTEMDVAMGAEAATYGGEITKKPEALDATTISKEVTPTLGIEKPIYALGSGLFNLFKEAGPDEGVPFF